MFCWPSWCMDEHCFWLRSLLCIHRLHSRELCLVTKHILGKCAYQNKKYKMEDKSDTVPNPLHKSQFHIYKYVSECPMWNYLCTCRSCKTRSTGTRSWRSIDCTPHILYHLYRHWLSWWCKLERHKMSILLSFY